MLFHALGHVSVGGWDDITVLENVDLFPPSACSSEPSCSIPDLPQPRLDHSLSLLSGGRLVVCGGRDFDYTSGAWPLFDSCISWQANTGSWASLFTMRWLLKIPLNIIFIKPPPQCGEIFSHGVDAFFFPGLDRAAWRRRR